MPRARYSMCVVEFRSKAHLIGGLNEHRQIIKEIDSYDPFKDKWSVDLPPLNTPRYNAAAIVLNNRIFIIGGRDKNGILASVEMYNPQNNQWRYVHSINERREALSVVFFKGL